MMLNADVHKGGERGLVKCGQGGGGYEKGSFYVDILYGRPLSPANKLVLGSRQSALTSQGRIEILTRLTIPLFASRPRSPTAAAISMTSKLVMLAS